MSFRPIVLFVTLLVGADACAGETVVDASLETPAAAPVETSVGTAVDTPAELPDDERGVGDRVELEMVDSYEEWRRDPLGPLVPNPEQFGPEWGNFGLLRFSEQVLIDPTEESFSDECQVTEPIVIREGFYAEFGAGQSPDDALVLVSQGSPDQMEAFYRGMLGTFECEAGSDPLELRFAEHPAPELPGVIESTRFSTDDNLGQHSEGLLLRRDDLVYMFVISAQDGAAPIDVNTVVAKRLAAYDAQ